MMISDQAPAASPAHSEARSGVRLDQDVYLDANATTPVLPIAQHAAQTVMAFNFGNPSSTHSSGLRARAVLDCAHQVAQDVLGAPDGRVFFTSGATESIQTAVLSALHNESARRQSGAAARPLLLYGATEHKAVPEALKHWNHILGLGCEILPIPVNQQGQHDLAFIRTHAPRAILVCTMAVNNETGIISDLPGIEQAIAGSEALWLVDSVQALGKLTLNMAQTRIDYASFSGHKLYATKGIGLLYVRPGAPFTPLMVGGGQEAAQRGGTENLPGIAAFAAVLKALADESTFHSHAVQEQFRQRLAKSVEQAFPGVVLNAPFATSVSTTLNFSVPGLSSKEMLDLFDAAGIRVSSGSACNSNKVVKSFVLDAMGLEAWRCASAVRMSFGPATTAQEIDDACIRIGQAGAAIRNACLLFGGMNDANQAQTPANGLIRPMYDTACCWIYAEKNHNTCIIIDPLPELADRIVRWVNCRNLKVQAVLATDSAHSACRAALQTMLQDRIDPALRETDSLGWPELHPAPQIGLPDGSTAQAIQVGLDHLINLPDPDGSHATYLLASQENGATTCHHTSVRIAFIGDSFSNPERKRHLVNLVGPRTLLLAAHDPWQEFATTLESENLPASAREEVNIPAQKISDFLAQHPKATVVDVREAYEHDMDQGAIAVAAVNAPLSRLPQFIPDWLRNEEQELLFVCRSGARSNLAATCLRRLGHRNTWHLVGGLALQQD